MRSLLRAIRIAAWGALLFLPISVATADSPRPHPSGQPRLPFLRRYAKPAPAGTEVERAPASVSRRRPSPNVKVTKRPGNRRAPVTHGRVPAGRQQAPTVQNRGRVLAPNARARLPGRSPSGRGVPAVRGAAPAAPVQFGRSPITREPAQVAPAASPPKPAAPPAPYAASPQSPPSAPTRNIQLRDPNDKSQGSRSIKLDMTRPYLR